MSKHTILGRKVQVYIRENSSRWRCATFLNGKMRRTTTKEDSLARAKEFAEDWYLELRGKRQRGELLNEKSFGDAAKQFTREYEVITDGERSPKWVEGHKARIRLHLLPFFGKLGLSQVTAGTVQDYRILRMTKPECAFRSIRSLIPTTSGQPFRSIWSLSGDAAELDFLMSRLGALVKFSAGATRVAACATHR